MEPQAPQFEAQLLPGCVAYKGRREIPGLLPAEALSELTHSRVQVHRPELGSEILVETLGNESDPVMISSLLCSRSLPSVIT